MGKHSTNQNDIVCSREIQQLVPYSVNHLRRLEAAGQFPRRIRLGANRVGWLREEVGQWIDERIGGR